ncbi:hypothetical protein LOK74_07735 [Brevibacillus humidisoli]|uniref:hypothetical protein n=1 Tax=Brevibacillus humidisoli TaxID=2895522 RepID=UPI001E4FECA6|nr:hypothetical protein [Brevibacillus humidisoli]UFJ42367.1 hypothetical protein LOK74_07735 [Brevibacillus humidisoli]
MDIQVIEVELQRRQDAELAKAHEWIIKLEEKKETECYCRRSAYSEMEMWLDLSHKRDAHLTAETVIAELDRRAVQFQKEAEKYYAWKTESTGDEYRWQAEALKEMSEWIRSTAS